MLDRETTSTVSKLAVVIAIRKAMNAANVARSGQRVRDAIASAGIEAEDAAVESFGDCIAQALEVQWGRSERTRIPKREITSAANDVARRFLRPDQTASLLVPLSFDAVRSLALAHAKRLGEAHRLKQADDDAA
jgi:hypothetical protein